MFVCHILPYKVLQSLPDDTFGSHLVVAPYLLETEEYLQYFVQLRERQRRHEIPKSWLILDNGVAEGYLLTDEQMYELALRIDADEMVLTDILHDGPATVDKAKEILGRYGRALKGKKISLMGVPQGKTEEEYIECARQLIKLGVNTLGVSYISVGDLFPKNRYSVAARPSFLVKLSLLLRLCERSGPQIHCLGLGGHPVEIFYLRQLRTSQCTELVRTVDTSAVWAATREGLDFEELHTTCKKLTREEGFFEQDFTTIEEVHLFYRNLWYVGRAADGRCS